jgi:cytochrome c
VGFKYSPAMRAFAQQYERWSGPLLERYIMAPETLVPKNTMNFNGLDNATERAGLIAYLHATGVSR